MGPHAKQLTKERQLCEGYSGSFEDLTWRRRVDEERHLNSARRIVYEIRKDQLNAVH